MRLLMFMAQRFWWRSYSKTLEDVEDVQVEETVTDAAVVFMQVEAKDAAARDDVFRKTLKNIKWLANKRDLTRVVLHSFTHLGGENAEPEFASSSSTSWPIACAPPVTRCGSRRSATSTNGS